MNTKYEVRLVDDDAMPAGHDWMVIDLGPNDRVVMAIRRNATGSLDAIGECWAAARLVERRRDRAPRRHMLLRVGLAATA